MPNVNNMDFYQLSTVLNAIRGQVTGVSAAAPVTEAEFVSVGNAVLKAGYDPVLGAITQVLSPRRSRSHTASLLSGSTTRTTAAR